MVNRITTLSIICFLALHGATTFDVAIVTSTERVGVMVTPITQKTRPLPPPPIQTYNALLTTYAPELFADLTNGIVRPADEAFDYAANEQLLALKLKPINQILQEQAPHNTVRPALDEALHPLLNNHPFSVQITQYMHLLILVMYEMQSQLYEMQSQRSDTFEEAQYLSQIFNNEQSLKKFLRNVADTVTTRTHNELSPLYLGACHTLNDLMQTDFSILTPRISCQPITLLEEIGALTRSHVIIHFDKFQRDRLSSVEKFYELVSGAKRLRTCHTTMLHIDTLTHPERKLSGTYLALVRIFATVNLQNIIDQHLSESPAKVYGYILELCIQLCHLGNMPGVYDTSSSSPLTNKLFKPHYYQHLWEKIADLQGFYTKNPLELFGSALIRSVEFYFPDHPAPQQYLKENYPKGFKKHNSIFQITLITSRHCLLPNLFVTPRDGVEETQQAQYLAIIFLPESTTPSMKKLAAHNMKLIYQNLQTIKEHTPARFLAKPAIHAQPRRLRCSIMDCLYSLLFTPNHEESAPLLRQQSLTNPANYGTLDLLS